MFFFVSSRRRHTRSLRDWSSDVCSSDLCLRKLLIVFTKGKDDQKLAQAIRAYMAGALPVYEQVKKLADDLVKDSKDLGELKLDDLRRSLNARDTILVIGDADLRVIPRSEVWQEDTRSQRQLPPGQTLRPRFAGEQQISTAILA